ncbi:MAG: S-layer homology domain-containing protein [Solibacillus sp.]
MRKKIASIVSLLVTIVCMVFILIFNNQSVVSANPPLPTPILGEFTKTDPKATFILSGMTAQEVANNGINYLEHYIQMTETNMGDGTLDPNLIFTYSQIPNIEITGVVDGGNYNTNVTPQFNVGSATLNGSPFTSGTQLTAEGSYTLTVTAGSQLETIQFRIDKTPPTGEVIVNLGNQYTNGNSVLVSISPDAGVTDITHIQFSFNGSAYTRSPYVPSFMVSVGFTDGDKVLKFKLVDRAGNESTEYETTITRDTAVPTGSIVINNGNVYTTTSGVTLNLSLGNGVTDVVAIQFSNNNSSWSGVEAFSPIKSYTLPAGDGNKTVYVRLIDRAGNITIIQDSIILDTTPPTGTVIVNDGKAYTNNSNVYVDITPAAGVTDIVNVRYTLNGLPPTTIAYTNSFTINVGNTDGAKAITVELIDGAGQVSPVYSATVTLDTSPPTGSVIINGGAAYTASQALTLDFGLGAGVDDVERVQFSNDNVIWSDEEVYSPSMSYTLPTGDRSKTVYVRFLDRVGNIGLAQASVILDTNAPVVSGVTEGISYNSSQTITFNEGIATLNGHSFASGTSVNEEDNYTLIVTDYAGNATIIEFTIDKTVPIVSGVAEGVSYYSPQTITFNEGTAKLNGNSFVSGSSVNEEGSYTLIVTDDAGNSITITFSINKTARILYTVKYDGNGATGGQAPVDSQTYENGHSVTVADNTGNLVRGGFTFNGWNAKVDGSGINYVVNNKFTINASNVTLYAMWKINRYTMSFESNGGSVVTTQNISYKGKITEPAVPTKLGYTFGGWFKEATLINSWDFTKDTVIGDTTLYAKWNENGSSGGSGDYIPTPETNPNPKPTPEIPLKPEIPTEPEVPVQPIPTINFSDISSHWAKEMIEDMASRGIINGYLDGTFRPNEPIQRQHVAVMLTRIFELNPIRTASPFNDVSPSHTNFEAIMRLQQAGIIDGMDGMFNPKDTMTRAQMAKVLVLAFGLEPNGSSTFKDVPATHWASGYIATIGNLGIALGDNGEFKPNEPMTRAQFVAFLSRALNIQHLNK